MPLQDGAGTRSDNGAVIGADGVGRLVVCDERAGLLVYCEEAGLLVYFDEAGLVVYDEEGGLLVYFEAAGVLAYFVEAAGRLVYSDQAGRLLGGVMRGGVPGPEAPSSRPIVGSQLGLRTWFLLVSFALPSRTVGDWRWRTSADHLPALEEPGP